MIMQGVAMRLGPVPVIMIMLALSTPLSGPAGAELPPDEPAVSPDVTLQLFPTTGVAGVSYSEYATVLFRGEMLMNRRPVETVVVTLTASVDTGWSAACSPTTLIFTSNTYTEFQVTVAVPPRTLASALGILSVDAQMTGGALTTTTSTTANVTVYPYHMLRLKYSATSKDIKPDGKANFRVEVQNLGNEDDSYILSLGDQDKLQQGGWKLELVQPAMDTVPPNASMEFQVYIIAPRNPPMDGAGCNIDITVTSRKSVARPPVQSDTVIFRANLSYNPLDYPVFQVVIIAAVLVTAAVSLFYWRRRRKRISQPVDVEEAPPT
jgi:hypothetical protein